MWRSPTSSHSVLGESRFVPRARQSEALRWSCEPPRVPHRATGERSPASAQRSLRRNWRLRRPEQKLRCQPKLVSKEQPKKKQAGGADDPYGAIAHSSVLTERLLTVRTSASSCAKPSRSRSSRT